MFQFLWLLNKANYTQKAYGAAWYPGYIRCHHFHHCFLLLWCCCVYAMDLDDIYEATQYQSILWLSQLGTLL